MFLPLLKYWFSMAYLFLQCELTIGNVVIRHINQADVKSSWKELTDTCSITLPRNLDYKGERLDQMIKRLDPVTLKVAYTLNGITTWHTEFVGYVREVQPNIPVRIQCEDEMLKLKTGQVFNKLWKNAKLIDIISTIAPGYVMNVKDATLSYRAENKTAAQIMYDLREYIIYSYFRHDAATGKPTLYSGFAYDFQFNNHIYNLHQNVRPQNSLTYRLQADTDQEAGVVIKAIAHNADGSKTIEYWPSQDSKGEVITMPFSELSPIEATRRILLKQYAQAEFKRLNVDGYRGDVSGFATPIVRHGDTITVRDAQYPDREGKYLVDATRMIFDADAIKLERISTLGPKAL